MDNMGNVSDTPVTETSINDDFDSIADEIINENDEAEATEETSNTDEAESDTNTEGKESEEIDFKPFLEYLSKNTKYNKENVNVDSIEEVINNFQKGLNYEKLQNKIDSLENGKALSYINKKANELGLSVDEYMEQVEEYEKEQEREKNAQRLQEMIESGVPEDVAKEVIATSELRKQLQEEKNQLEKQKREQEEKQNKDKEYDDFIKEFPDVKAEEIPKEVFEAANSKGQTLLQAYKDYLYVEMKKELDQMKQNKENEEKSIGSTQNYGGKDYKEPSDLFLEGFDS